MLAVVEHALLCCRRSGHTGRQRLSARGHSLRQALQDADAEGVRRLADEIDQVSDATLQALCVHFAGAGRSRQVPVDRLARSARGQVAGGLRIGCGAIGQQRFQRRQQVGGVGRLE